MDNPVLTKVGDLFNKDIVYIVPEYQRWYVWSQDIQWESLWSDILNLVEGTDKDKHYMGTILTKYYSNNAGEPSKKIIVDGQQRITTLQIILLAINKTLCSIAKNLTNNQEIEEMKKIAKDIQTYTENTKFDYSEKEKVKILHFKEDHDEFYSIIKGTNSSSNHVICECCNYFEGMFNDWLNNSSTQMINLARNLREAVLNNIIFSEIELDTEDNEFVIFETLNARGKPLTEWGKTKNHFMSKAKDAGHEDFYKQNLHKYDDDKWWTTPSEIGTGKKLNNIENMLRYWLEIQESKDISDDKVYYALKKHVGTHEFMKVVSSFNRYADIFKILETYEEHSNDSVQSIFMYHRKIMRTVVTTPLMMRLFHLLGEGTDFDNCTRIIESYLVRRAILHLGGRRYDTLFVSLLQKINGLTDPNRVIPTLINALTNISEDDDNLDWPDDSMVRKTIIEDPIYNIIKGPRTRMILEAVNRHITPDKAEDPNYQKGLLTIEHIMPKGWEKHWNLPDNATDEEIEKRKIAVDKLGNLTLLSRKLNSSTSNSSWDKKRDEINKYSAIFINKELLDSAPKDKWAEKEIGNRCEYLAKIICEIWPHAERFKEEFNL